MKGYEQATKLESNNCKTNDELERENESLRRENSRLQKVLQEVTTVNKRWQRYNTDRRIYVQKLLATIQDLQEQMNEKGEAVLQASASSSTGQTPTDIDQIKRQYDEQLNILGLQIKSHKEDFEVEYKEKKKALQEKEVLAAKVQRFQAEINSLEKKLADRASCCSCQVLDQTHLASQDFSTRTSYETSFQVPFSRKDSVSCSDYSGSGLKIEECESPIVSETKDCQDWRTESANTSQLQPASQSIFIGFPNGDSTILGFSPNIVCDEDVNDAERKSVPLKCPNCFRLFPQSRKICFLDHVEFCKGTDKTEGTIQQS